MKLSSRKTARETGLASLAPEPSWIVNKLHCIHPKHCPTLKHFDAVTQKLSACRDLPHQPRPCLPLKQIQHQQQQLGISVTPARAFQATTSRSAHPCAAVPTASNGWYRPQRSHGIKTHPKSSPASRYSLWIALVSHTTTHRSQGETFLFQTGESMKLYELPAGTRVVYFGQRVDAPNDPSEVCVHT